MTEKKLTEARRLANEILPKVQKMQRDMYFNNRVSLDIDNAISGFSFYVHVSYAKDDGRHQFKTFYFFDFYDVEENDETFERLAEYVKAVSAA